MSKIKTTGQFREFLIGTIKEVRDGSLDVSRANSISKLAAQVNENFYAEVKSARLMMNLGTNPDTFGDLAINKHNVVYP